MLRWRPNGHNIFVFTERCIIAIVCGIHICVGIALFCIGSSNTMLVVVGDPSAAAKVVYNPLIKTASQPLLKNKNVKKNTIKKNETVVKEKKTVQKDSKKTESTSVSAVKNVQKKNVEKPKTASVQSSVEKKQDTTKKIEKSKQVSKELGEKLQSKKDVAVKITEPVVEEYVVYIGRDDQEGMRVQALIKEAVSQQWRSPSGFEMSCCTIEILITKTGQVKDVAIQQQSGSPAYDIAARNAAANARYPKEVWNKKLILQFGKGLQE